jgi:hypothetical protein
MYYYYNVEWEGSGIDAGIKNCNHRDVNLLKSECGRLYKSMMEQVGLGAYFPSKFFSTGATNLCNLRLF